MREIALANLRRHAGRTCGLALLVCALAFCALGGVLVMSSLQNGLDSLEARLGADVLIGPKTAKSKVDLESILIDGTPGQFYMDKANLARVAEIEGVEKVSPQYYLATVKAGCCSMPVQVIGFDPATDFTVQPWIARAYADELGTMDVLTGANITGAAGSTIMFYGKECRIVGRLDETGTALDNAVFATGDTLASLIEGSSEQGLGVLGKEDPEQVISTIQVKVADGYDAGDVADYVNVHLRDLSAVQAKAMTEGVANGVAGMSRVIGALVGVLCAVAAAVLVAAFTVAGRHRAREFAVLRVAGASRAMLSRLVLAESAVTCLAGSFAGCLLAIVAVYAFNGAIEGALGLPFLMPDAPYAALAFAAVLLAALAVGCASSALSARSLSRVDAGEVLRGE